MSVELWFQIEYNLLQFKYCVSRILAKYIGFEIKIIVFTPRFLPLTRWMTVSKLFKFYVYFLKI